MTCHFVRWASTEALPELQRLPDALIAATQGLTAKRRERYLKGRVLLAEMMFYFFGYPVLPALTQTPSGRPCFVDSHLPDFSLAYTGNTIALLLSEEGRVGLDIEIVHLRAAHPSAAAMQGQTPAEQAWINAQSDPLEAATQLCTLRRAVMKLPTPGHQHVDSVKLHPASGRVRSTDFPALDVISDIDDYLAWACARLPALNQLIRWDYTANGGLRKTGEIVQHQPSSPRFIRLVSQVSEKVLSA